MYTRGNSQPSAPDLKVSRTAEDSATVPIHRRIQTGHHGEVDLWKGSVMKLQILVLAFAWLAASIAVAADPERLSVDGKKPYFGTLHAHSVLSGDVAASKGFTPQEAFEFAREAGLDFLGISDHHKPKEAPGGPRFNLDPAKYKNDLFDVAKAINSASDGSFVAIPGIEWGTIATGNHLNIFGSETLPWNHITDEDYDDLIRWAAKNAAFVQMNHPYSWGGESGRNKDVGNYGRALYSSDSAFVAQVDPVVKLMSIICTVAGGHMRGEHRKSEEKTHRDHKPEAFREYLRHLDMGFHLSPAANQDTHGKNPGAVTAARTGVWADDLSYVNVIEAIQANRVFATEDDELAVSLRVEYDGKTYWMGEDVPLNAEEADVTLLVDIQQVPNGTDPANEGNDGAYSVILYSDSDGVGGRKAAEWDTFEARAGETNRIEVPVIAGEYIFIEIVEQGGKDNPIGDGEDEDGTEGRDNLNDSAWTTPVWFTGQPDGSFVWSKNSKKYHVPDCWAVKRIGAANRREGGKPAGMTKHACKVPD